MSQVVQTDGAGTLRVVIRSRQQILELVAQGALDRWTIDALLRDLVSAYEPCHTEIHLDLREVGSLSRAAAEGLASCRAFARSHGARIRITPPGPEVRDLLDLRTPSS